MDATADAAGAAVRAQVDPLWMAMLQFRERKFEACAESCTELLARDGRDQAAMFLKCRALTMAEYVDDTELEEEGMAELLLDDNTTASVPRPGTSLNRPMTGSRGGGFDQSIRPVSSSGRPLTGFARPGTVGRPITGQDAVRTAMKDWWWKARLGKCYYKLGLFRDAEKQLKSSIRDQDMVSTHLELQKVFLRLDQPKTAQEGLARAIEEH